MLVGEEPHIFDTKVRLHAAQFIGRGARLGQPTASRQSSYQARVRAGEVRIIVQRATRGLDGGIEVPQQEMREGFDRQGLGGGIVRAQTS